MKKTAFDALIAAFPVRSSTPFVTKLKLNQGSIPRNRIEYTAESVKIITSSFVLTPPMIFDPERSIWPPDVLNFVGVQSNGLS